MERKPKNRNVFCPVIFAVLFWAAPAASALTVENVSDQPVELSVYGETVVLEPKALGYVADSSMGEPWLHQLMTEKKLRIVRDPKK